MPTTPPINLKQLKERGMLDEEKFFADIATEAHVDSESVKKVYAAMVRVITRRLVQSWGTRMPHLGDFGLPLFKARKGRVGNQSVVITPRRVLKFYPKNTWNKHIAAKLGYSDY